MKNKERTTPLTVHELLQTLGTRSLTMQELAEETGCLTDPQPNDEIRRLFWIAVGEGIVRRDYEGRVTRA